MQGKFLLTVRHRAGRPEVAGPPWSRPRRGRGVCIQPLSGPGAVRWAAMRNRLDGGWAWEGTRAPSRQRRPISLPARRPPVRRRGSGPFPLPARSRWPPGGFSWPPAGVLLVTGWQVCRTPLW